MHDPELTTEEFNKFRSLIYQLTGISLNEGKRNLVQSRLQKRLRLHGLASFSDYYQLVQSGDGNGEQVELINCITTNKTDFFREPHHFEFITEQVVPEIAYRSRRGQTAPRMRVWHAGCSSGEEPYTLAMTLREAAAKQGGTWDIRQLASDIDTHVLAHAEAGIYEEERIAPVPADYKPKYFLRGRDAQSGLYKVRPELRSQITFRRINLLDEEWPIRSETRFDIIFCRNVIIYFDKPTQKRLFARFAQKLKPGGYLFIGHSESLHGISDEFTPVGRTIYQLPAVEMTKAA
jgi:chemotaxis protein methyltransferase CheR